MSGYKKLLPFVLKKDDKSRNIFKNDNSIFY